MQGQLDPVQNGVETKIVGGTKVWDKSSAIFKHSARLLIRAWVPNPDSPGDYFEASFRCSASIVGERTLLTAAHCLPRRGVTQGGGSFPIGYFEEIEVLAFFGLNPRDESPRGATVVSGWVHPDFSFEWWKDTENDWNPEIPINDIALLELRRPIPDFKQPATLIEPDHSYETNQNVTLTGFGRTESQNPFEMPSMRYITVDWREYQTNQTDYFVGAGRIDFPEREEGLGSACNGDSGGPGFIEDGGTKLAGVIVRGPDRNSGGCFAGVTILTDIKPYYGWVLDTIDKIQNPNP